MKSVELLHADALVGRADRHWYQDAHFLIAQLADRHKVEVSTVAGVAAVLSPRISVSRNATLLARWFGYYHFKYLAPIEFGNGGDLDVVTDFITAVGLTRGHGLALAHYLTTGVIRGPKTSQFAMALAGNLNACPLDIWMARALQVDQPSLARRGPRALAVSRITQVAHSLGWKVAEAQAAIWAATYRGWYASPVLPSFSLPE